MDQSETQHLLRLPVFDCPQFDADLRNLVQTKHMPTAAELAARVLAANAPSAAPVVPLSPAMRAELRQLRASLVGAGDPAQRHRDEWNGAGERMRCMLVVYADLRTMNPALTVADLADRAWDEFPESEKMAVAQAVRMVRGSLARLGSIGAMRVGGGV